MPRLKIFITLLFCAFELSCLAQKPEKNWSEDKIERKNRPFYLGVGLGINNTSFRDFATSPLIYSGSGASVSFGTMRIDQRKETTFNLNFSVGNYTTIIAESFAASSVFSIRNSYQQLFRVSGWSNERWNIKAGGRLGWTLNTRSNGSLGNNSFGFEIVGNAFGSIKVTRDLSTKNEKTIRLWFLKYKLKPLTRSLAFQVNTGIVNKNVRNGFAYLGQDAVLNEPNLLEDYRFNFLSGFRVSSTVDYTIHLTRGNLVQLTYYWDAYHTGNEFARFELASHQFLISLWFRTK